MATSAKHAFRDFQSLRSLHIGLRLRLAFACVFVLMFVAGALSLWSLRELRAHVESVSRVEQRTTAILQIDNSVLNLMNQLHRAADTRQRDFFESETIRLMDALQSRTAAAVQIVHSIKPENERQRFILDSLNAMLEALPARVSAFRQLAHAEDWLALHARLLNQVDRTDDVVAALVNEIDSDLAAARERLVQEVEGTQRRMLLILAAASLASLMIAAILGVVVTRSISRPLARLQAGTQALSEGRLGVQVEVKGSDELAHLAAAFNRTSRELNDLYGRIRASEARFRSLIENASDLIVIVNMRGEIRYASPSALRVLGFSGEALRGKSLRDLLHPEDLPAFDALLTSRPNTGQSPQFEIRVRHSNGSVRVLEGVATDLWDDPYVSGIVVNARDITERKAAEQVLHEREEQLRQAQKLEAIGLLAGGVAHDFNNLLTVINGYSEFLLGAMDPADSQYGYAKSIRQAGERAAALTRQLLAFGRKQMLRPAILDLNEIVSEVAGMLRRLIGEDVELLCRLDPLLGGVEADPNQIHQVLINLAANARDAMPRGGTLTIATANTTLLASLMRTGVEIPAGQYVLLSIEDTGSGMDETTRQRIFEPFFTTKKDGKGTGLGLASVYGIVRQSGGHIVVESAPDEGTTFQIYLPRVDRAADLPDEPEPAHASTGTETILVVEDEPEVRQIATRALRDCGYRVMEAGDAKEALARFGESTGRVHLLMTDVVMPGMTGVDLSRQLLALDAQLKTIYVSGYADSMLLRQGEMVPGAAFLQKPYRPSELAAKVREILRG